MTVKTNGCENIVIVFRVIICPCSCSNAAKQVFVFLLIGLEIIAVVSLNISANLTSLLKDNFRDYVAASLAVAMTLFYAIELLVSFSILARR